MEQARFPHIRLFQVPRLTGQGLREDVDAAWQVCTPEKVSMFSGVAYFFGRELHRIRQVPIGLIDASLGGTRAEAWTRRETLVFMPHYADMVDGYEAGLSTIDQDTKAYEEALAAWESEHCSDDADDIHPTNKQDVGKRLSLIARHFVHDEDGLAYSGPVAESVRAVDSACQIDFLHAESGLVFQGDTLLGFEVAGEDGTFFPAMAAIEESAVRVSSDRVTIPRIVRYAWAANPECNLYNAARLPEGPFQMKVWEA
jgi:hypothetical protein